MGFAKFARATLLGAVLSAALVPSLARAQTGCTSASQSSTLNSLRDGQAAGSITPQVMRNFVCSTDVNAIPATVSAAGGTASTATALTNNLNVVTSVAANTGVIATSTYTKIVNEGANTLNIYPPSGAQLEAYGTNVPVAIGPGATAEVTMSSPTQGYVRIHPSVATPTFTISNGQIFDPTGAVFRAYGLNVWGCAEGTNFGAVDGGTTFADQLRSLFPGLNYVRIAFKQGCTNQAGNWGNYKPSDLAPFVNDLTSHYIVVEIEDHDTSRRTLTASTSPTLAQEHQWYVNLAAYYKTNPWVWFGTMNEPGYPATTQTFTASISGDVMTVSASTAGSIIVGSIITGTGLATNTTVTQLGTGSGGTGTYIVTPPQIVASEAMTGQSGQLSQILDIHSAIRNGAGSNAPLLIAAGQNMQNSLDSLLVCGTAWCNQGTPSAQTLAAIATMRNIIWEDHNYGVTGTTTTLANQSQQGSFGLAEWQLALSADGLVPTIVGEGGNSANGSTLDSNAAVEMQSNYTNPGTGYSGAAMWFYNCMGNCTADMLNMTVGTFSLPTTPSLSAYGQNVQCYIQRTVAVGTLTTPTCPGP